LFEAFRGRSPLATRALSVLDDPSRSFVSSVFLELETLPKAVHFGFKDEEAFLRRYFATARRVEVTAEMLVLAQKQACDGGLGAMDALHVAAAATGGATDLITAEKPTGSIFRATAVRVISLHSPFGMQSG